MTAKFPSLKQSAISLSKESTQPMLKKQKPQRHPSLWPLQEARKQFGEVVQRAKQVGPQCITKNGIEYAWLISAEEYQRLSKSKESLLDFFQNSPLSKVDFQFERRKDLPREINL